MTVANGEVLRLAVRCKRGDEADVVNVFHALADFTAPQPDLDVLLAAQSWMESTYAPIESYIPADQNPIDIKVDVIQLVGGLVKIVRNVGTVSWGGVFDPTGAGEGLPRGVAALVFFLTTVGKVFARKYLGTLTEAATAGDSIVAGLNTALGQFCTTILAGKTFKTTEKLEPGILSTRTLQFEPFQSARVRSRVGYQRRRAPGVGS